MRDWPDPPPYAPDPNLIGYMEQRQKPPYELVSVTWTRKPWRLLALLMAAGAALGVAATVAVELVNGWPWAPSVVTAYVACGAAGAMSGVVAWTIIDHRRYWRDRVPPVRP